MLAADTAEFQAVDRRLGALLRRRAANTLVIACKRFFLLR